MSNQRVTVGHPGDKPDWKGIGYLVSIVSVFFLGALAWPKPDEPNWHVAALIAGMATSILGMGFRYKAHLDQLRELKKTEAKADGQPAANSRMSEGERSQKSFPYARALPRASHQLLSRRDARALLV